MTHTSSSFTPCPKACQLNSTPSSKKLTGLDRSLPVSKACRKAWTKDVSMGLLAISASRRPGSLSPGQSSSRGGEICLWVSAIFLARQAGHSQRIRFCDVYGFGVALSSPTMNGSSIRTVCTGIMTANANVIKDRIIDTPHNAGCSLSEKVLDSPTVLIDT